MKSITHITTALLAAGLFQASDANAGEIKCWRNKDNVRECGHSVPPEYAQKRIEVMNSQGVVKKVIPAAKTKEELEEERRLAAIQKQKELEKMAQKRQDLILLQSYTTEKDLLLAKKQNVRAIDNIIKLTSSNTETLKSNLISLEKQAADYERIGEKPPETLLKDMDSLKNQIKDNEAFIKKKQEAKLQVAARFDKDLKRFRHLKSIKP